MTASKANCDKHTRLAQWLQTSSLMTVHTLSRVVPSTPHPSSQDFSSGSNTSASTGEEQKVKITSKSTKTKFVTFFCLSRCSHSSILHKQLLLLHCLLQQLVHLLPRSHQLTKKSIDGYGRNSQSHTFTTQVSYI